MKKRLFRLVAYSLWILLAPISVLIKFFAFLFSPIIWIVWGIDNEDLLQRCNSFEWKLVNLPKEILININL